MNSNDPYNPLPMRIDGFAAALALASMVTMTVSAQAPKDTIEGHLAAATTAAGQYHHAILNQLCAPANTDPATLRAAAARRGAPPAKGRGRSSGPPPVAEWHREPAKVFDNLYWVGQSDFGAWALKTSAGIII